MALNTRLFVGNLPEITCDADLKTVFSSYGEVVNVDIKTKSGAESENKKFAFVTLSSSNYNIESCIQHFSNEDFHGSRLYVTRARESFLERLQREREQAQTNNTTKVHQNEFTARRNNFEQPVNNKRKFLDDDNLDNDKYCKNKITKHKPGEEIPNGYHTSKCDKVVPLSVDKKQESEKKRLESMKKKRQEFKEKKMIIKTGLTGIDKVSNKKIIFSDDDDVSNVNKTTNRKELFDGGDSDEEINFEIKEQFEGKKGQKVLDLQSRYKSDKRFILDERFAEQSDNEEDNNMKGELSEDVELNQTDEKSKQLNILQDLLGVPIKVKSHEQPNKVKTKLGMLRFDPLQPEHAKFFAPVEPKQENISKSKKKKKEYEMKESEPTPIEVEKVEVSKEQFYEVSDVLKETLTQPTEFSLRSLFSKNVTHNEEESQEQETQSVTIEKKDKKVKNPLDPGEKNPFVYDSSESEDEEEYKNIAPEVTEKSEVKAVWRENLFFSQFDSRLKDGLEFFNTANDSEIKKERRELKSVMKKRLYNKERKNKMFQKKIGGRKKTMKKNYRKKS
ncbi:unnamed protein product [Leptosia nina]|uniref:RRM domain-containing protein n=1 Tax=Leptosia nina TaxID=320188 RepID=A0AAV1JSL2_9NEOP